MDNGIEMHNLWIATKCYNLVALFPKCYRSTNNGILRNDLQTDLVACIP